MTTDPSRMAMPSDKKRQHSRRPSRGKLPRQSRSRKPSKPIPAHTARDHTASNRDNEIEVAINQHLEHERVWLRQQLQAEHVLQSIARLNFENARTRVTHLLAKSRADICLKRLAEEGCDRNHIMNLLTMILLYEVPPRWLGFDSRRRLLLAVKTLRNAAEIVNTVEDQASLVRPLLSLSPWFAMAPLLPSLLDKYCDFLIFFADSKERKQDAFRELLVAHVRYRTNTYFDNEVASLIAAVRPESGGYSAEAHSKWRARNKFLKQPRSAFQKFEPRSHENK